MSMFSRLVLPVALTGLLAGAALGQPVPATADDLDAFFGGLMPAQLEAYDVPGAVVSVVRGGETVFARGYGHADLEADLPVDPDTTLFRIGSVTKTFTYTAVMQLLEQGRLDLDTDVNAYLREVRVPDAWGEPVTIRHLMTHTAGFEENVDGLFGRDPAVMRPLAEVLADELPARVRAPGRLAAYSNHGIGLLGLVVADVTGVPFERYVEDEILAPLGMTSTTARQPLPERLAPQMSGGYRAEGGAFTAQPFTFVPLGPAGAMSASGTDMARFMMAHLQDGAYQDVRILNAETAQRMRTPLFQHDPRLPGMAYGFYETRYGGARVVGHDGGMVNFTARMMLIPEHDLGVFVAYNAAGGGQAMEAFAQQFAARYLPGEAQSARLEVPQDDLRRLAGAYLSTRSVATGEGRLANLIQTLTVTPRNDGTLRLTSMMQPPMTLGAVEPGLWQDARSGQRVVFDPRDGRPVAFIENVPVMAFEKLPWHATPGLHTALFLASVAVLLSAVALAPFTAVLHRRLGDRPSAFARGGRAVTVTASVLLLAFVAGLGVALIDYMEFMFGEPGWLTVLFAVLPLAAVLALAGAVIAVLAWRRRTWSLAGRIHYTAVTLALLTLLGQMAYWNLLRIPGLTTG